MAKATESRNLKGYSHIPKLAMGREYRGLIHRIFVDCWSYIVSLFGEGFLWSVKSLMVGTALLSYYFMTPSGVDYSQLILSDYLLLLLRNAGLMFVCAGGLHLYFHTFHVQGNRYRYFERPLGKAVRFWFGNQVWDNMFWTMTSGVLIWTFNEGLCLYLYDSGYMPRVEFGESVIGTIWFFVMFLLLGPIRSIHFFIIHYFLHWKPMYKSVHILHHRNIHLGPWAGLSMHPVEHMLYLCPWITFFVLPTHPLHLLFLMQYLTMGAAFSHTGYERMSIWRGLTFPIAGFYHQLHHTHYDCNYGIPDFPIDRMFGTWEESEAFRERA